MLSNLPHSLCSARASQPPYRDDRPLPLFLLQFFLFCLIVSWVWFLPLNSLLYIQYMVSNVLPFGVMSIRWGPEYILFKCTYERYLGASIKPPQKHITFLGHVPFCPDLCPVYFSCLLFFSKFFFFPLASVVFQEFSLRATYFSYLLFSPKPFFFSVASLIFEFRLQTVKKEKLKIRERNLLKSQIGFTTIFEPTSDRDQCSLQNFLSRPNKK